MKALKLTQILLLILVVVILSGILITLIANGGSGLNFLGSMSKNAVSQQQVKTFSIAGIQNVKVDIASANIVVIPSENNEIRIIQKASKELNDNEKFIIEQNANEIQVTQQFKPFNFFFFNLYSQELEVYLPSSYKNDIDFKTASGNTDIKFNLALNNIRFYQVSGDFYALDIIAKNFFKESVSGDIKIGALNCEEYTLKNVSGNINLEKLSGKGNINNVSGNINVKYEKLLKDANIHCVSGNVTIGLSKELAVDISAKCTSGNINANFAINQSGKVGKTASAQLGTAPFNLLNVNTVSGNIRLNKDE
jgi:DUF4097 and DUF4098 domain-containing protein YvlB